MSDKQRKMRLAWFVLLSAAFRVAVSCQPRQQVAMFDNRRRRGRAQTGDIGQRLRGPDRTDKLRPDYVKYDEYLTFTPRPLASAMPPRAGPTDANGNARSAKNINDDSKSVHQLPRLMADGYTGADGKKKAQRLPQHARSRPSWPTC
jgi:hypothetical protein